jgi:polyisoprenoid-binding protein YceI
MCNKHRLVAILLPALFGAVTLQCGPSDTDAATVSNANRQASAQALIPQAKTSNVAGLRFGVAPFGNEVRYRIREQLVRVDLPNDAVGETADVTGGIAVTTDGRIITGESKFVVGIASLKSDRDRRDGFVRRNVLQADQYPTVEFAPTAFRGLPKSLPASGSHTFDVIGNLTVRGVTRPTTWHVTAESKGGQVRGAASTAFTFKDFNIDQPRVPIVLSVADTIKLEYDFTLVQKN